MKTMRILFGVLCIAALAACGSPADDLAFKAPGGWNSTPGIMGRFQMWMHSGQLLMLIRGDKNMTLNDAQKTAQGSTGLRNLHNYKQSRIAICGGQQVDYFTGRGQGGNARKRTPEFIEGIIADVGDARYLAIYIRPVTMPPDSQAETALHSVCKK